MVTEAILALKERSGSSVQAIKKHIVTSHPDLAFAPHQLRSALKKGTEAGKYVKVCHERNVRVISGGGGFVLLKATPQGSSGSVDCTLE